MGLMWHHTPSYFPPFNSFHTRPLPGPINICKGLCQILVHLTSLHLFDPSVLHYPKVASPRSGWWHHHPFFLSICFIIFFFTFLLHYSLFCLGLGNDSETSQMLYSFMTNVTIILHWGIGLSKDVESSWRFKCRVSKLLINLLEEILGTSI